MPRGRVSKPGDTMVNANGYHHTRTTEGWRLTHHLIAEAKLGRPLGPGEMTRFADGDRANLDPDNIEVFERGRASIRARLAVIEARLAELYAEKAKLERELNGRPR